MENCLRNFKIFKNGFTLAEVLITLVIIGVVAALTIPTAIGYYKKEETVSKLKKSYSTLGQAINRSIIDNGHYSSWNYDGINRLQWTIYFVDNYLFPYLQVVKKCTPTSNKCWPDNVLTARGTPQQILINSNMYGSSAVLSDGTTVFVTTTGISAEISVDINGHKSPNVVGRDIFMFVLGFKSQGALENIGLQPYPLHRGQSVWKGRDQLINDCAFYGDQCSGLIVLDGWQIKSDYPIKL